MFTKVTATDAEVAPCPPLIGLKTIVPVPLQGVTTEAGTGLLVYVVKLATCSVTVDEPDLYFKLAAMALALPVRPNPGIGSCSFSTLTVSPTGRPWLAAPGHTTSEP
jgi:hypothetical protein